LAVQALLYQSEGDYPNALGVLEQALTLAQPGGFIRLFADLGPQMAHLLAELRTHDSGKQQYIGQIVAAFEREEGNISGVIAQEEIYRSGDSSQPLPEPLTNREIDVLELLAQRLTNKEIAERLVISLATVRTHNRNIFAKLNVNNRRQAAIRARALGLIAWQ
jgi:LuxR family maltose regulon positive regulatory protein